MRRDGLARNPRTARLASWAKRERERLIQELGGACAYCGARRRLEIDHIKGTTWVLAKKSRWMRVVIYRREAMNGLLQVLCRHCNARKN